MNIKDGILTSGWVSMLLFDPYSNKLYQEEEIEEYTDLEELQDMEDYYDRKG